MPNFFTSTQPLIRMFLAAAMLIGASTFASAQEHGSTGEEVYLNTCNLCHGLITQEQSWYDFVPGEGSSVLLAITTPKGPTLNGIVNRPVAIIENYPYSRAMREFAATGAIWDRETLDQYLADSRALVPGFMILKLGPEDRRLVLDYLTSVALH